MLIMKLFMKQVLAYFIEPAIYDHSKIQINDLECSAFFVIFPDFLKPKPEPLKSKSVPSLRNHFLLLARSSWTRAIDKRSHIW
jgi:hypothetical protein